VKEIGILRAPMVPLRLGYLGSLRFHRYHPIWFVYVGDCITFTICRAWKEEPQSY